MSGDLPKPVEPPANGDPTVLQVVGHRGGATVTATTYSVFIRFVKFEDVACGIGVRLIECIVDSEGYNLHQLEVYDTGYYPAPASATVECIQDLMVSSTVSCRLTRCHTAATVHIAPFPTYLRTTEVGAPRGSSHAIRGINRHAINITLVVSEEE